MMTILSIKTRLIGAVSVLMIASIMAITYSTLTYFESTTKELISEEQFAMVSLFAGEIDDKLTNMHDLLIVLSKRVPPGLFRNPKQALDFLKEHVELHKLFDNGLYLFDESAILVAEAPQVTTRVGKSFSHRKYLSATISTRTPYISDPYFSSMPGSHPSIMLTAPVFGPDGELIGVLGGGIDLLRDNIVSRLISTPVGKTGYFYVITRDRRIILHPDRSRILKQDVPVGANKLLEKAILGFEGTDETVNSRGLYAISSFKKLAVKDWLVAANYPVAEAYRTLYQARNAMLLFMSVTILVVPVIVWYLMNLLTRPLLTFTRHVESIQAKHGEDRLFPIASSDEIGKLTSAFNTMVTDLDRHQAEIEARKEEVEKLVCEVGEFNQEMETLLSERTMSLMALTVADRVRNPAALIAGVCNRLSRTGDIPEKMKESLEIITDSSKDLEAIVSDFQSLLKSRQSKFAYEDLNKVVEGVVLVIAREAYDKGVRLSVDLSSRSLMINTQLNLLKIAIFHLIKNAIEATPEAGIVSVSTSAEGNKVLLSISDTGSGIPKEIISRIFDPFFTTKGQSFGMGLPLVKQVVTQHMGEITVESEEGRGTTFRLVFPERWKEK
jgi:signal transduction histidine kinase